MSVISLLEERYSARAYLNKPVRQALLEAIFKQAQQAPSNCNVQPWQTCVVSGDKKEQLKNDLIATVMKGESPNPDFNWLPKYEGIHRDRQFGSANALYSAIGVTREDKKGRQMAMIRNWQFFDAPHVGFLTMPLSMGAVNAIDVGIYLQSLMLLMVEHGLASCPQGALAFYPDPICDIAGIPEGHGILCGLSFGYADEEAKINEVHMGRADLPHSVKFVS